MGPGVTNYSSRNLWKSRVPTNFLSYYLHNKEFIITFVPSITNKKTMPTRKEAEEYKRRIEKTLIELAKWDSNSPLKDKLINDYLDKWKAAHEALLGLGLPLED